MNIKITAGVYYHKFDTIGGDLSASEKLNGIEWYARKSIHDFIDTCHRKHDKRYRWRILGSINFAMSFLFATCFFIMYLIS